MINSAKLKRDLQLLREHTKEILDEAYEYSATGRPMILSPSMKTLAWRNDIIITAIEKQLHEESNESITEWAETTFGPATIETMVARAAKEFKELEEVVARGDSPERVAFEAADVMICLARVIVTIDPKAIDRKMAINRARQWHVVNGVGQHIRSKEGEGGHEHAEERAGV